MPLCRPLFPASFILSAVYAMPSRLGHGAKQMMHIPRSPPGSPLFPVTSYILTYEEVSGLDDEE